MAGNVEPSLIRANSQPPLQPNPVVRDPIVRADSADDAIVYAAVDGNTDGLCALDRNFYAPEVLAFCRQHGIEVMTDVEPLRQLRAA